IWLVFCRLPLASLALADAPAVVSAAPAFKLQDQNNQWHQLADFRGQWVVLYFYPKDDTPGCTTEACAFRDSIFKFRDMGVQVLGVSLDNIGSHKEFAEKYHLPFPLLADSNHDAAKAYGVLTSYMGFKMASRETFVINPDGIIVKHYADVDPEDHSVNVLADVAALQKSAGQKS